jgi:hypothetical protein
LYWQAAMKTTENPQTIYDLFDRSGFAILRIDQFDRGDYAEVRAELPYREFMTVDQLQELILKLKMMEKNESITLKIVHIDLIHRTIRVNIHIHS